MNECMGVACDEHQSTSKHRFKPAWSVLCNKVGIQTHAHTQDFRSDWLRDALLSTGPSLWVVKQTAQHIRDEYKRWNVWIIWCLAADSMVTVICYGWVTALHETSHCIPISSNVSVKVTIATTHASQNELTDIKSHGRGTYVSVVIGVCILYAGICVYVCVCAQVPHHKVWVVIWGRLALEEPCHFLYLVQHFQDLGTPHCLLCTEELAEIQRITPESCLYLFQWVRTVSGWYTKQIGDWWSFSVYFLFEKQKWHLDNIQSTGFFSPKLSDYDNSENPDSYYKDAIKQLRLKWF